MNNYRARPRRILLRVFLASAAMVLGCASGRAQITSLQLDLRGNYASVWSAGGGPAANLRNYGQFYNADVTGFILDRRLLSFGISSSITDYVLTSSAASLRTSNRNRYLAYYNASATLFPDNSYPLTVYASRFGSELTASRPGDATAGNGGTLTGESRILGLRWSVLKNTYYPQLELTVEKAERENHGNLFYGVVPFGENSRMVGLRASNSSDDGMSGYVFYYNGRHIEGRKSDGSSATYPNSPWIPSKRAEHDFQLTARSALAGGISLTWDVMYGIRPFERSRSVNFGGEWVQGETMRHQLTIVDNQRSLSFADGGRFHGTDISQRTHVRFSGATQGMIGADVAWSASRSGRIASGIQRQRFYTELTNTTQLGGVSLTTRGGINVGREVYDLGRKFVHASQLGITAVSHPTRFFELQVSDEASYARDYFFGNLLQNGARVRGISDVIPRSVVEVEVGRDDFRYVQSAAIPARSVTNLGGKFRTNLSMNTMLEMECTQSWWRSSYRYWTNVLMASLVQNGLLPRLALRLRGNREYSSLSAFALTSIDGTADYALGAFTVSARYTWRKVSQYQTHEVFLEIRRPFSFDFR
jgi:hypothetical protein